MGRFVDMTRGNDFTLCWDLHEQNRTSVLKSLWEEGSFIDVTLACDDGQIDAHKVLLSTASPVIRNILLRNPNSHPLLYLRGTKKKDVQALLGFIYLGWTKIPHHELGEFLELSTSLQVKGLYKEEEEEGKDTANPNSTLKDVTIDNNDEVEEDEVDFKVTSNIKSLMNYSESRDSQEFDVFTSMEKKDENYPDISEEPKLEGGTNELNEDNKENSKKSYKFAHLISKKENGWECNDCHYFSGRKGHVNQHLEKHMTGLTFPCDICGKVYTLSRSFRKHRSRCTQLVTSRTLVEPSTNKPDLS